MGKLDKYTPDQPKVPGADVIYRPAGEAGEYAPLATNPYKGCGHACKYCYVPLATHQDRAEFNAGAVSRKGFLERLLKDCVRYERAGVTDQVMLSFATDPYHPGVRDLTRPTLLMLAEYGMGFCTLTKGGTVALEDLQIFRPGRDAFASTLTSIDENFSRKWEPNAPLPHDRMLALKAFHERGIFTWVSVEPTLDVDASLQLIRVTSPFVDLFKIGRANYLKEITRTTDWEQYTHRVVELCNVLRVKHYIKRDLQPYLPKGYDNPLRVPQYH